MKKTQGKDSGASIELCIVCEKHHEKGAEDFLNVASFAGKSEWACESCFLDRWLIQWHPFSVCLSVCFSLALSLSLSLSLSLFLSALTQLLELSQIVWASKLTVLIRLNLSWDLAVTLSYFSFNGCFEDLHGIRLDWPTSKLLYGVLIAFTVKNL